MMKNGLECLGTGGFMARQVRDAAASGPTGLCGDREKASQGLIVLWQMIVRQLFPLSTFNTGTWQGL